MTTALILCCSGNRRTLVDEVILPSCRREGFDEILVVGTHHDGPGYRYLHVPSVTGTTVDALIKRDVGALATEADVLVYLADDHALAVGFGEDLKALCANPDWDVAGPSRVTVRDGEAIRLNMGVGQGYIGGHGIVVRRRALQILPWMAGRHSLVWDVDWSQEAMRRGTRAWAATDGFLVIEDVEPGAQPWLAYKVAPAPAVVAEGHTAE